MPLPVSTVPTRRATSQLNMCSGYPAFVAVPVVLQGLVCPRPAGTSLLIARGSWALPPLWPGSSTTIFSPAVDTGVDGSPGEGAGDAVVVPGLAGALGGTAAGAPWHAASSVTNPAE